MAARTKDGPVSESKKYPSDSRKMRIYVSDALNLEIQGAENRSRRLDEMAQGYALMRRALCPSLSIPAWSALMGALRSPLPRGVADDEIAITIGDRMALHEKEIAERLSIDAKALIRQVRRWSPGTAWAVADVGWRFWRMSEQLGVRAKLVLLGIEPTA